MMTFPIRKLALKRTIRRKLLHRLLLSPDAREEAIHCMADFQRDGSSFKNALAHAPDDVTNFEDFHWLFASNELSHSLAQLRLDEAAWLYQKIKSDGVTRIVELGRFKGGTTFLLASANTHVISVDNEQDRFQTEYDKQLREALSKYRLTGKVQLVKADALQYCCETDQVDMVLVHFPLSENGCWQIFKLWWPKLNERGNLIFHSNSYLSGVARFLDTLFDKHSELRRSAEQRGELVILKKPNARDLSQGSTLFATCNSASAVASGSEIIRS